MISRDQVGNRFPVLPLGTVCDFLDHLRRPVTESDRVAGPYPYYGANGQQGTISTYLFDEPLVLLAEDGGHFDDPARGIAYRIVGKTWVNNHAHVLRAKPAIIVDYLAHVLEHYDVSPFVTGTTRGKLTKAGASIIPIPVPPLEEQRRIAAILDQVEALRAKRRQALAKLETLTQSLFLEMFGDPRTQSRWPTVTLDQVSHGGQYGLAASSSPYREGLPRYIRITDIDEAGRLNGSFMAPSVSEEAWSNFVLHDGDLLFARTGATVGKCLLYEKQFGHCVFAGYLIRFQLRNRLLPEYVASFTKTESYREWVRNVQRTVAQPNINARQYGELTMPAPPMETQMNFSKLLKATRRAYDNAIVDARRLDQLASSLQHRAFRGEL